MNIRTSKITIKIIAFRNVTPEENNEHEIDKFTTDKFILQENSVIVYENVGVG